jgi:hypothetical protein
MATNDFQTFAAGGGANVLTQAQYLALTSILANGFSAGVAPSAQLNKVWRQSSIMSAVLAQFTSDYSGQNSTDDGTTATLETNLIAAIRSVTKTSVILADTGAANAYTATNVPALTSGAWIDGVVQQVKIAHANTGASTYAPDGLTAIPIYGLGLQPLQGGELALNGTAVLMHATIAGVNSGNPIAILMECAGGAQQVALATKLLHAPEAGQVQQAAFNYAGLAGGTANAITATLSPAPGSYSDYLLVTVRIAATNTSSASLNVNGLGVVPVIGLGHQTLQGGELFAGGFATFAYSTNYSEAILLECTGGALQVAPATQSQHAAQLAQLLAVSGPQAVLSYTNSTTITLSRYRTGYVYSPGYGVVQIPSGGLTATASGLTSGTLYYVYLNPNSGSPTLVASTTAHQTDASGVEVMVGDNTKVLVGMAYAVTATSWLSVVRSWVHDRGISLTAVLNTSSSTNSTTPVNVNTGLQISFLAWTSELAQFSVNASCSINTTNTNIETYISLNNSAISGAVASATPATTNVISETVTINSQSVVEGLNTVNMFGQVGSSSATGTWYANQTSTNVTIAPRA